MARSNQGGTRGFIRGRVGLDLYQVTKDARGRRIQLVRSVEEGRTNPNTMAQAMARMQMALCMSALTTFREIVDHSFETIPYGQLSIAHFVKKNIPLIQQDCKDHWRYDFLYDYPQKGVTYSRSGAWLMSEGSLQFPENVALGGRGSSGRYISWSLSLPVGNHTMAQVKSLLGLNAGDYITHCAFAQGLLASNSQLVYSRTYLNPDFPDEQIITANNIANIFLYEGNVVPVVRYGGGQRSIVLELDARSLTGIRSFTMNCLIFSRWDGRNWCRNTAQMTPPVGFEDYASDWESPWGIFQTWYPDYDPEASDDYPL